MGVPKGRGRCCQAQSGCFLLPMFWRCFSGTILTKVFADRVKNTGDCLGCRSFLPLPTKSSEFQIGNSGNLPTRVRVCVLNNAKSPIGMIDLKLKRVVWGIGSFTVADFKFWRICQ